MRFAEAECYSAVVAALALTAVAAIQYTHRRPDPTHDKDKITPVGELGLNFEDMGASSERGLIADVLCPPHARAVGVRDRC